MLERSITGPAQVQQNIVVTLQTDICDETKLTMRYDALIVVRVDTHLVALEIKGILAEFGMFQFILVQIWPPPEPSIDDMWEPLPSSYL